MNTWAALFCLALTTAAAEDRRFYKTDLKPQSDQQGEKTENNGFVEPLDFASFTQQFFTGANNFQSLPFTANQDGGFDFFGAESKESKLFQPASGGGLLNFPTSPFSEEKQNSSGFVQAPRFISPFDGHASPSTFFQKGLQSTLPPARPTEPLTEDYRELEEEYPSPTPYRPALKKTPFSGKSNYPAPRPGYKSDHSPTAAVYANSEDVEVFLPRDKLLLPQINGRPKPYDGYRAASDVESQVFSTQSYPRPTTNGRTQRPYLRPSPTIPYKLKDRRAQTFGHKAADKGEDFSETKRQEVRKEAEELEDEDEEDEEEVEEDPKQKKTGFKYQYDTTITVPDLVIRTYPYEKPADNDREFTGDYETYTKSLPDDLERHYGTPDFIVRPKEDYTVAATENLSKNTNCERIEPKHKKVDEAKTCYVCHNPETGGSYEQCAYEEEPKSKKFFYGGATSSATQKESKPIKYRYRRSLDSLNFQAPSSYEYFIYNDEPNLKRRARAETNIYHSPVPKTNVPKRKKKATKKYTSSALKKVGKKRKPRQEQIADPSSNVEGPPASYDGPRYTYEGPSQPYEGPSGSYEGPSIGYEGPDHDNYYDRTDDRIPYKNNPPLLSSFFGDLGSKESQKRPRRKPKKDFEEFDFKDDFSSYRFGPEYFSDDDEIKPEPIKRNVFPKISSIKEDRSINPETSSSNEEFFSGNVKIFKNGDVCEKKKKDNMVCMVCNNDKSGATYEQCQYSTKPSEQRYAFNREKSFTSNKPEQGDRYQRHVKKDLFPEKSDKVEKKFLVTKVEKRVFGEGSDPHEPVSAESRGYRKIRRILKSTDMSAAPSDEVESKTENVEDEEEDRPSRSESETSEQVEPRDGIEGLDDFLAHSESKDDNFPKTGESYEDYFKRVFPEFESYEKITPQSFDPFSNLKTYREDGTVDPADYVPYEGSSSENKPTRLKDESAELPEQMFPTDTAAKQDLEDAYGAFQKKDWSKCKKTVHDKMVCHQCLDKNGVKNEECMYVDLGQPVQSHKAYHEKQEYDPAASSIAAVAEKNRTEPTIDSTSTKEFTNEGVNVEETMQQVKFAKGDFEGVERTTEKVRRIKKPIKKAKAEDQEQQKKKKQPVKKYQKEEQETTPPSWESKKSENADDESVIRIYLNGTNPS